jgi:hypothetical protein
VISSSTHAKGRPILFRDDQQLPRRNGHEHEGEDAPRCLARPSRQGESPLSRVWRTAPVAPQGPNSRSPSPSRSGRNSHGWPPDECLITRSSGRASRVTWAPCSVAWTRDARGTPGARGGRPERRVRHRPPGEGDQAAHWSERSWPSALPPERAHPADHKPQVPVREHLLAADHVSVPVSDPRRSWRSAQPAASRSGECPAC